MASESAEILGCIRCGACMNVCPVYTSIGGHAYGDTYPGPVGAVLTPACAVFTIGQICQAPARCAARAVTCVRFAWTFRGCCFTCVTTPRRSMRRGGCAGRCEGSGWSSAAPRSMESSTGGAIRAPPPRARWVDRFGAGASRRMDNDSRPAIASPACISAGVAGGARRGGA